MTTKAMMKMTTSLADAENMGAPTQEEIAAYQSASADAQLAGVKATLAVAEAQHALSLAQADLAGTNAIVAKLNVVGAELQQRVNFSREAANASPIVTPGQASKRGLASLR